MEKPELIQKFQEFITFLQDRMAHNSSEYHVVFEKKELEAFTNDLEILLMTDD